MRKFLINLICVFIPSKKLRRIIKFGIKNYISVRRKESGQKFPYFLSVIAIAKNEGPYFQEWIEFHRLVGVDKFYIYDNESSNNTREILQPYIDSGIVEYKYFPGNKMQIPTVLDAIKQHKNDTKWLAHIDLDEFLVPVETQTIPEFLRKLPGAICQVLVKWRVYGSSGHKTKPDGLVIENYKMRADDDFEIFVGKEKMPLYKAIINPRFALENYIKGPHSFRIAGTTIDETHKIRINHYWIKSEEEYAERNLKGCVYHGKDVFYHTPEDFRRKDTNIIFDDIMDKWIEPVKRAISGGV